MASMNTSPRIEDTGPLDYQKQVNVSCLDLLMIEIIPLATRVVEQLVQEPSLRPDECYFRIEGYGYRMGRGMAEVFTRERPRFVNELDIVKFICRDLWLILFKKNIDNLKTNHRVSSGSRGLMGSITSSNLGYICSYRQQFQV